MLNEEQFFLFGGKNQSFYDSPDNLYTWIFCEHLYIKENLLCGSYNVYFKIKANGVY